MMASRVCTVVAVLALWVAGLFSHSVEVAAQVKDAGDAPRLINTCVITSDVKRLVDFYEPVLKLKAKWSGEDYAEFPTAWVCLRSFRRRLRKSTCRERARRR